ncbi:MAG: cupin domain-containing protein, partial [Pseudomonadota bacterium]
MRTDDPMYNLADRCLFPVGAARFLQEFYTDRCGVFRPGDDIDPDTLLSLEQIEMTLAASGAFETASVAMRVPGSAQPGFVRSMADVYDALSKGQGLQIARYDRLLAFDHPLSQMFRAFGVLCRAPCHGMTVFLSPPGAVLPAHNDPFEIFTLQVQGTKTWRIHGFAPPQTGTDVQIDVDAPVEIHHLSRGDIFYVPKGIVHDVLPGDGHSQEGFSLSVALIYRPPAWESLVQEIATDLAQDRRFWRSLPPDGLVDGIEHRRAL